MARDVSQWYVFIDGLPEGPMTVLEVAKKIRSGQVLKKDLLYKEGEEKWRPAGEFQEFQEYFSLLSKRPKNTEWVVLTKRKIDGELKFQQIGPMEKTEVLENIKNGLISTKDYIWQDGMSKWIRIDKHDKFEELNKASEKSVLHLIKPKKILDDLIQKKNLNPVDEPMPEDAEGVDLATQNVDFKELSKEKTFFKENKDKIITQVTKAEKLNQATQPADENDDDFTDELSVVPEKKQSRFNLINILLIVLGASILVGVSYFGYKKYVSKPTPLIVDKKTTAKAKKQIVEKKTAVHKKAVGQEKVEAKNPSVVKTKQPVEEKVEPTRLNIKAVSGGDPKLYVSSNSSSHFKIWVYYYSRIGRIVNQKGFHWIKSVIKKPYEKSTTIDISKYNLPNGEYKVLVRTGDLEKWTTLVVGSRDRSYYSAIRKYRKQNAINIHREKKRLYTSVKRLVRISNKLNQYMVTNGKGRSWSSLRNEINKDLRQSSRYEQGLISSSMVGRVYFPLAWKQYSESIDEIKSLLNTINSAKLKNNYQGQVKSLVQQLKSTQSIMASLSSS